jgi:5-methylcytosine-specific restriction endonuclease McrA
MKNTVTPFEKVLLLNSSGLPIKWISLEAAAVYTFKGLVNYSVSEEYLTLHGGVNKENVTSILKIHSVISVNGFNRFNMGSPIPFPKRLGNTVFIRDGHVCAYCEKTFDDSKLTKDHIHPLSEGGSWCWSNIITACARCNHNKGSQLISSFGKPKYGSYKPTLPEYVYLTGFHYMTNQQREYLDMMVRRDKVERANYFSTEVGLLKNKKAA